MLLAVKAMKGRAKPRQKLEMGNGGKSSSDKRELRPMDAWRRGLMQWRAILEDGKLRMDQICISKTDFGWFGEWLVNKVKKRSSDIC